MSHIATLFRDPLAASRRRLRALIALWLVGVAAGWYAMASYSFRADAAGAASAAVWPDDSALPRVAGRPTLAVFLHPQCPCSRATVAELERVLAAAPTAAADLAPRVIVVAVTPAAADESWTSAPLIARALSLPGATSFVDRGGAEAQRFGAINSGVVAYYDADGRRQYFGGVTIARGHEGPSAGGDAVAALLTGRRLAHPSCPAFGCRLVRPDRPLGDRSEPAHAAAAASTGSRSAAPPSTVVDAAADDLTS
jgi:hypothetical protein